MIDSPDRVPRKEAFEKVWGLLKIGEISIPTGVSTLQFKALSVKAGEVAEVKSLVPLSYT